MKAFNYPLTTAFIVICLAIIPFSFTSAHLDQPKEATPAQEGSIDLETMALATMEIAERRVSQTAQEIKKKLSDKSIKARAYGPLRTCMKLYNDDSYSFGFGLLAFKEKNYDVDNYRWLNAAQKDVEQCECELNKVGYKGEDLGVKTDYMLKLSNSAQNAFQQFTNKMNVVT